VLIASSTADKFSLDSDFSELLSSEKKKKDSNISFRHTQTNDWFQAGFHAFA
jgi:hypothetical protein